MRAAVDDRYRNFVDYGRSLRTERGVYNTTSQAIVNETMTLSDQPAAATPEGFPVDASTKYKMDAGQCEQCGYYKTWGFKVQNKKSGKMM